MLVIEEAWGTALLGEGFVSLVLCVISIRAVRDCGRLSRQGDPTSWYNPS